MKTFLLTWNPNQGDWDPTEAWEEIQQSGSFICSWSSGKRKNLPEGSRIFLLRLGQEPRGIVAAGYCTVPPREAPHWREDATNSALFVEVEFEDVLDPEEDEILLSSTLRRLLPRSDNWSPQSSGVQVDDSQAEKLEELWSDLFEEADADDFISPEEVEDSEGLPEGALTQVQVNTYERSKKAREACIAHHGTSCSVCSFSFKKRYGEIGEGYIHVHHLVPLAETAEEYLVDPIQDLRPVCPNCHAMLHRRSPPYSIEELKRRLIPKVAPSN